jgi:electron transport complex protein RnfE
MPSSDRSADFTRGLVRENPVLGLMLGLCSVLAVSTEAMNAAGMGAAMTFVLLGSNILVSLLGRSVPPKVRLPVFIVVIASFTTVADLLMNAYAPGMHEKLGIFIPLIVVNCIIIARAEAFASRNPLGPSILDALGMGAGYTLVLFLLASIREVLGNGTFWGVKVHGMDPVLVMMLPSGAFITIGLMMAALRGFRK